MAANKKLPEHRKAALVTGASKRVGAAIALSLAENGYDIALHCHKGIKAASTLSDKIIRMGVKCEVFPCDLADSTKLVPLMESVFEDFPNLNVLINNASSFERISYLDSDIALFDNHMAINARAPIFLTQYFAEKVRKGHVINMLDTDVVKHHGSHFMYLLSKKTLAAFTQMAARDLSHIQVNGICPGGVLPSEKNPANFEQNLEKRIPLKQLPQLEDIISSVLWLLKQPRITGQLIFNDSGQHLL